MLTDDFLNNYYDSYPQIEEEFQNELDRSLRPRSRELRFDLVDKLDLSPGSVALDVGCGEGRYGFELAKRFGFVVHGFDPVTAHIKICKEALNGDNKQLIGKVDFTIGSVTDIAADDESADLVWCYDVLEHVEELDEAFAECYRVLRPGGYMLIYSEFATEKLENQEKQFLFTTMGFTPKSADPNNVEAAFKSVGFKIIEKIELMSEWEERSEEDNGNAGRHLLHAARLLRNSEPYISKFGQKAYDIMLGDCYWHIYAMIGKLSPRIYVLQK